VPRVDVVDNGRFLGRRGEEGVVALIYVVEDDASIRGELLQVLERNGYETR